jgi:hypothetical protein
MAHFQLICGFSLCLRELPGRYTGGDAGTAADDTNANATRLITRVAFGLHRPEPLITLGMLNLGGHHPPVLTGRA